MGSYVVDLDEVDAAQVAVVGGKGAQLAALRRVEGVRVPPGFCVTTAAFRRALDAEPSLEGRLARLAQLGPGDREAARALVAELRAAIEAVAVPGEVAAAVAEALGRLGEGAAVAVRSSATAEDQPSASFAGQHDSYLNVTGPADVLRHVARCWASLFTERAVAYRDEHGLDHRRAEMAVVVQQLVDAEVAGVLFTADPVTSNRRVATVEATYGLGEALVAGSVGADVFRVRDDVVLARQLAAKAVARVAVPGGGTEARPVDAARQGRPSLDDGQVVELVRLGRRIEAHRGPPQDIEWCLVGGGFVVVQSRPITTLFPIPAVDDGQAHVYLSVGHQQMMTDPMTPFGLSLFQMTAMRPMDEAGGRLFVDVTAALGLPATRAALLDVMGRSDPLMRDALETVLDRGDLVPPATPPPPAAGPPPPATAVLPPQASEPLPTGPEVVAELVERIEAALAALATQLRGVTGPALFDLVEADIQAMRALLFDPLGNQVVMAAMEAAWWLNDQLEAWLDDRAAADVLVQSVPGNPTAEMGLALLGVADVVRPHPEVVAFLEGVGDDDGFLDGLASLPGGAEARRAIDDYLGRYGSRCVGEIDIARPRWRERPSSLVPLVLSNVRNFGPGAGERRFEAGRREAEATARDVLARLRDLPDGAAKADEAERMIERVRAFMGYREHPKFGIIRRYALYKEALVGEAERLVAAGVLGEVGDAWYLTFAELRESVRTQRADLDLVARRREAHERHRSLHPPRVLTSEGEALDGAYRRGGVPEGALVGLAVSAGVVEGRARVVLDVADADVGPGDILVTTHTDPSWSPLFVSVAGLVTEVGGLMTHGSVIAREYGLPAVVGVQGATRRIPDGRRIRLHGTDGYVELLG